MRASRRRDAISSLLLCCFVVGFSVCFGAPPFETRDGGIIRGPAGVRRIALVFTGHEFAESGQITLDQLARHDAKASFFLTGDFLANTNFAPLVRRIIKDGHYLGPHSDKHLLYCSWEDPKKTLVTRDEFRADLARNLQKIEAFGVKQNDIRYFLPAYEHYNDEIAVWSKELGLTLLNYTPGTRANADYTGERDRNFVSSKDILRSIFTREQRDAEGLNGFMLLSHIGAGPGRKDKFHHKFDQLLDYLHDRSYEMVRVDELLSGEEIFIRGSQVGYGSRDSKIALAFSKAPLPERFDILKFSARYQVESDQPLMYSTAYRGKAGPITGVKWSQFENHTELDFSKLKETGCYVLRIGNSQSRPFCIGSGAQIPVASDLLPFMREQRCGYNPWLDAKCHTNDGRTAYGPLPEGTRIDATGGWHDAADLLKYLLTSGNATAQMLLAYQLAASGSQSRSCREDVVDALGRPRPNGIPDLLDEARWGLDWMLKLHPAPDQLYHQVADDRDHTGRRLPQNEIVDYGWGKGGARVVYFADGKPQGLLQYKSASTGLANLAGRYAAAMALAYQIWKDDPRERLYAEQCLKAGKEVYEMGRAKEGVQQGNSYKAPYRYEETTWADDMEWGAAELYRATHERPYLDDAKRYAKLAGSESWMGKEQTGHYQYYPFMNVGHFRLYDLADREFKKLLAGYYREGIESCVRAGERNPYRVGVPFIWCSNNLLVALVTQCLLYERMTGDHQYREFAAKQRDWLLGRNPWGYSMFGEIGAVSPKHPHLMTMELTGRAVRGGLVDGPVYERIFKSLKGVAITEPDPLAQFQGPAVYHDDIQDYSSNEPTMDGTASAILMFSLVR
jgi:peptidoglycan/xylan/chitin deacetylase (PgdA/CDA1 family)